MYLKTSEFLDIVGIVFNEPILKAGPKNFSVRVLNSSRMYWKVVTRKQLFWHGVLILLHSNSYLILPVDFDDVKIMKKE